jgi:hypothetical protein
MTKIGIGVGEDFPVDDATTPPTPPPGNSGHDNHERRHWRRRFLLHILTRVGFIAAVIAAIVWMFSPGYFYPGPYARLPPYGYYPYPHHFFFFPFFPILLIAIVALAWRRRGCYGHRRHWHDGRRAHRSEGA